MESHESRADQLEREADRLEKERDRVDGLIEDAREDWDAKQSSTTAPGAADAASAAPGGLGEEDGEEQDADGAAAQSDEES
jgi:hypothetical protein